MGGERGARGRKLSMRRWLLILICLSVGACARPTRTPRSPDPGRPVLRVMTYNVNFGLAGDADTLDAIGKGRADVAFLQETTPAWERALRMAYRRTFPHMAFRHSGGAGGLAVLSRFPFTTASYIKSPNGWFPAWRVKVQSPLGPLQVLQVHLRPPVSDSGSFVSGYFTTGKFRRSEITFFATTLSPGLPTLVVGDFNEDHGGGVVEHLKKKGLRSALEEFHPGKDTWRWQTSLGKLTHTLDHILYSKELRPLNCRVLQAGRSDHLPVVALFQ